jgi:hypothetical protein
MGIQLPDALLNNTMSELASKKSKPIIIMIIIIIRGKTINTVSKNITTQATHTIQQNTERLKRTIPKCL